MKSNYAYSACFDKRTERLFKRAKYLGKGNNGIVYELPNNMVIKIFLKEKVCKSEGNILKRTRKSKYFPRIYTHGKLYIVREKVCGTPLDKYIKRNGLNREMSMKIYRLLKEFKKLGFVKLDTRCKDVYVTDKFELMMIDPKGFYTRKVDFPRHLMKKLNSLKVLNSFLGYIEIENSKVANEWRKKAKKYFEKNNIKYN
ncbi:protein kinase [Eubacterium multiforme]|uniref:RIO-like serine/threonine protein kinase n=1 Tax=Eubacterium multiforme TaxID=83339 RepID=A0ABT9UVZ9_9FIRM|nr:protein kinase [Eubacterium multiforme]MDQ0150500.1 RIO-like serine/threonine protein kinase [Eubacterium multiforme]